MATDGKKVVPVFLAILIAVGAALYLGMLSYKPEVVDEPTSSPSVVPSDGAAPSGTVAAAPGASPPGPRAADDAPVTDDAPAADDEDDVPAEQAPAAAESGDTPSTDDAAPEDDSAAGAAPTPPHSAPPKGMLDKETIQDGIRAVTPFIKACFEEGLKRDPSLAGRVVVSFDIEAEEGEGRITRGEVKEAETQSLFFEACVLREVAKAEFEAPRGGGKVSVTYPFLFDPGGGFGGELPPDSAPSEDD